MSELLPQQISVLFVDDQPLLLKTIARAIRKKAPDWRCRMAESGAEALALLKEEPADIVVSDMMMPGMDGVSLLQNIREAYPNTLRFILSGQSNKENILDSVGLAHQFFNKPIDLTEIIEALSLGRSLYKRIQSSELQNIVSSVKSLPTPKSVYLKIDSKLKDPNVELSDVSTLISEDAAISAKILQMVNSAFFGRSQRIDSIHEAVIALGVENVRSLILIVGVTGDFAEELNSILSMEAYANHSIQVAQLCRWLAKKSGLNHVDQDSLFTTGLLHNVGKLVLISHFQDYYLKNGLREDVYAKRLRVEDEKQGSGHALVGAALLALWGLPARIVNGVAFHHRPEESSSFQSNYALIVHIAEGIINYLKTDNSCDSILDSAFVNGTFLKELGMSESIESRIHEYEELSLEVL